MADDASKPLSAGAKRGDGTTFLYTCIRGIFRLTSGVFYSTTEVHGIDLVPADGNPMILCFNHGNSLTDPMVLIRKTPRMVRFCAKDSLWRVPFMNILVRNSGAVPVYRKTEHGAAAEALNLEIFRKVIGALRQGGCVGFAPEGVCRFLPYMEQPLKTGVARIALETVQQAVAAGEPNFKVNLVPVGLTWTHREKFRSDLCMRYCAPIVVDAHTIERHGGDDRAAARALTDELNSIMQHVTINAPNWELCRLAMTACRLHRPVGRAQTLRQYLTLLRGWVEVLKHEPAEGSKEAETLSAVKAALEAYQGALEAKGITCERVRRAAAQGQALTWYWCVWGMAQRGVAAASLFVLAAPALLLWVPAWWYVKKRERALLAKGPRWNDSVSETKMLVCTFALSVYLLGSAAAALLLRSPYPALLLPYFYAAMRCYEEVVADARSFVSLYKLLFLSTQSMQALVALRGNAKSEMQQLIGRMPASALQEVELEAEKALPLSFLDFYFPWWLARLLQALRRRKKKDWNEVLRLADHGTMDYFE